MRWLAFIVDLVNVFSVLRAENDRSAAVALDTVIANPYWDICRFIPVVISLKNALSSSIEFPHTSSAWLSSLSSSELAD